jgi:hypothetical protein
VAAAWHGGGRWGVAEAAAEIARQGENFKNGIPNNVLSKFAIRKIVNVKIKLQTLST